MPASGWQGTGKFARVTVAAVLCGAAGLLPGGPAAAVPAGTVPAGTISTVAGGVGGPAPATQVDMYHGGASFYGVCGLAPAGGRLYLGATVVRAISEQSDALTTPAGTGVPGGPAGDGVPAGRANLDVCGVATDHAGNLVFTNVPGNYPGRSRSQNEVGVLATSTGTFYGQAMTAGHTYTVAGTDASGFSGDGGPATAALLAKPRDVAVDAHGNLVIADTGNSLIRVIAASTGTFYGQPMTNGDIYTVAGGGSRTGNGVPATAAELDEPGAVAVDAHGNLVIADTGNSLIRVVAASTGTFYGQPMTKGDIYTVAGGGSRTGSGVPAAQAKLDDPDGLCTDAHGNLIIADTDGSLVQAVAASTGTFYGQPMTSGHIYTVAGDGEAGTASGGGRAVATSIGYPQTVAVDAQGNLAIGNAYGLWVVATASGRYYGRGMTAGHVYLAGGTVSPGTGLGNGGPTAEAQLGNPLDVAVTSAGDLVIADTGDGQVRLAATSDGTSFGRRLAAGHIYTLTGDTGAPAPVSVAVDGTAGVALTEAADNRVGFVAARSGTWFGQRMTAGHLYRIAGTGERGFSGDGGLATDAVLHSPWGATVDAHGNLIIADTKNERIRVIAATTGTFYGQPMTTGHIYTIAGTGEHGFGGDGGPAAAAGLADPVGMAVDAVGNLIIAEGGDSRIRVIAATTGTFYGQPMTTGHIYTIAGTGTAGYTGDGGPAAAAGLAAPAGVAVDAG